jgi:glycosyltransferase involved in cell wall biosynthesis
MRVDMSVLFGVEMTGRGHATDLIAQSEAACPKAYATSWEGGKAWIGATDLGESLPSRVRKHAFGLMNDLRVFSRLHRERYDLVMVKDKFLSGIAVLAASRLFRVRFVYWLSYPFPEHYLQAAADGTARYPALYRIRGRVFGWLLYRWLLPAAAHVFVQSEQMRLDIAAHGIPMEKMTAVPMGVRAEMCRAEDAEPARRVLPPGIPSVLYLGTLNQIRRLDFLLRAFAEVRTAVPAARLFIVGQGDHPEDRAFLEREVARLGLQAAVVFVGQLPRAQALGYVREADVCVSPFHPTPVLLSTSPTKLVEYLAMGKAVVANDHPEQRRVIEESGGGICVPYNETAFASAIVRLLEQPALAREMGERGLRYVRAHRVYGVIADAVEQRMLVIAEGRC